VHKDQALGTAIDYQRQCLTVRVDGERLMRGSFYMPYRWRPVQPMFEQLRYHPGASSSYPLAQGPRSVVLKPPSEAEIRHDASLGAVGRSLSGVAAGLPEHDV